MDDSLSGMLLDDTPGNVLRLEGNGMSVSIANLVCQAACYKHQ